MLPMIVPRPACAAAIWPHAIVAGTIHTIRRDHEPAASIREQQPSVTAVHASDPENGSAATSDDSVTASASASPPQHAANRGSPSLRRNHHSAMPAVSGWRISIARIAWAGESTVNSTIGS